MAPRVGVMRVTKGGDGSATGNWLVTGCSRLRPKTSCPPLVMAKVTRAESGQLPFRVTVLRSAENTELKPRIPPLDVCKLIPLADASASLKVMAMGCV